jgi:hypothetical protein
VSSYSSVVGAQPGTTIARIVITATRSSSTFVAISFSPPLHLLRFLATNHIRHILSPPSALISGPALGVFRMQKHRPLDAQAIFHRYPALSPVIPLLSWSAPGRLDYEHISYIEQV